MRELPENMTFHDLDIMAKTVYGEARGESPEGREAVAHVILNRTLKNGGRRFGAGITEVCLSPWQFSCWNSGDPNARKLLALNSINDELFRICICTCLTAMKAEEDPTKGSDHYHVTGMSNVSWVAKRMAAMNIGNHSFYNDIP